MRDVIKELEEYASNVNKYLLSITHDEDIAEELTQETMYRAILNIRQLKDPDKLEMWLCKIAKNLWYKEVKKRKRCQSVDEKIINSIQTDQDMEQELIDKDNYQSLQKKIEKLEETEKEIIYLRLEEDMKFKEIGKVFGKTENWARTTFFRIKTKLVKEVKEDESKTTM